MLGYTLQLLTQDQSVVLLLWANFVEDIYLLCVDGLYYLLFTDILHLFELLKMELPFLEVEQGQSDM